MQSRSYLYGLIEPGSAAPAVEPSVLDMRQSIAQSAPDTHRSPHSVELAGSTPDFGGKKHCGGRCRDSVITAYYLWGSWILEAARNLHWPRHCDQPLELG